MPYLSTFLWLCFLPVEAPLSNLPGRKTSIFPGKPHSSPPSSPLHPWLSPSGGALGQRHSCRPQDFRTESCPQQQGLQARLRSNRLPDLVPESCLNKRTPGTICRALSHVSPHPLVGGGDCRDRQGLMLPPPVLQLHPPHSYTHTLIFRGKPQLGSNTWAL